MKRLLAAGLGDCYQVCPVFRGGESGRLHGPEFTMIEWYRLGFSAPALCRDVEALLPQVAGIARFEPVSPYPPVEHDLAVIVDADVPAGRLLDLIRGFPIVAEARVFDVYTGDPIPAGKKSLAFRIAFQSRDATLTDEDASKQRNRIIERLRRETGAEPRG